MFPTLRPNSGQHHQNTVIASKSITVEFSPPPHPSSAFIQHSSIFLTQANPPTTMPLAKMDLIRTKQSEIVSALVTLAKYTSKVFKPMLDTNFSLNSRPSSVWTHFAHAPVVLPDPDNNWHLVLVRTLTTTVCSKISLTSYNWNIASSSLRKSISKNINTD